ncbi:MAG: tRNA pseudouridine(38-40) synthase TruA [Dehalococcoidia bacterium]
MHVALKIEYDGSRYSGFQFQPNVQTIQGEIEKSLSQLTQLGTNIVGAGRTDAGVHAKGQIVAFHINPKYSLHTIMNALNFYLPSDISVKSAQVVPKEFHPRRDATSRRYIYTILNSLTRSPMLENFSHHSPEKLEMDLMKKSIIKFKGIHDFKLFSAKLEDPDGSTLRHIYDATIHRTSDIIEIHVEGSSFLPRQVRRMVGAILDLGRSKLTSAQFDRLLEAKKTSAIAHSLPPNGLCLQEVKYKNTPYWDN